MLNVEVFFFNQGHRFVGMSCTKKVIPCRLWNILQKIRRQFFSFFMPRLHLHLYSGLCFMASMALRHSPCASGAVTALKLLSLPATHCLMVRYLVLQLYSFRHCSLALTQSMCAVRDAEPLSPFKPNAPSEGKQRRVQELLDADDSSPVHRDVHTLHHQNFTHCLTRAGEDMTTIGLPCKDNTTTKVVKNISAVEIKAERVGQTDPFISAWHITWIQTVVTHPFRSISAGPNSRVGVQQSHLGPHRAPSLELNTKQSESKSRWSCANSSWD